MTILEVQGSVVLLQIEDLRMSMSRMEREHGRREDQLRQEISDLQQVRNRNRVYFENLNETFEVPPV